MKFLAIFTWYCLLERRRSPRQHWSAAIRRFKSRSARGTPLGHSLGPWRSPALLVTPGYRYDGSDVRQHTCMHSVGTADQILTQPCPDTAMQPDSVLTRVAPVVAVGAGQTVGTLCEHSQCGVDPSPSHQHCVAGADHAEEDPVFACGASETI